MRPLPVRFRFHEDDHERYGDQWWTFDEAQLVKLRGRELVALDDELRAGLGLNLATALAARQRGDARGVLAVMWLARRLAGVVEPLAEFDPLVHLAESELVEADDVDPPASASSPSPASAEA